MEQGAGNEVIIGLTHFQIPRSGRAVFSNISFYDVASAYKMKFEVTVTPHSQTYSGMVAISNTFDVNPRQFYLDVATQVSNANQSVIFGTQPVVEVRDLGTGKRATPLKTPWWIAVSLFSNPKSGKAFLNGTFNVSVVKEQAVFTDLLVTLYGQGYVLKFESSYGLSVFSDPFEVRKCVSYMNRCKRFGCFFPSNSLVLREMKYQAGKNYRVGRRVGALSAHRPVGPGLQIFGLITLDL